MEISACTEKKNIQNTNHVLDPLHITLSFLQKWHMCFYGCRLLERSGKFTSDSE
jgi:hypothetical protein